jgi:hypothetical protein
MELEEDNNHRGFDGTRLTFSHSTPEFVLAHSGRRHANRAWLLASKPAVVGRTVTAGEAACSFQVYQSFILNCECACRPRLLYPCNTRLKVGVHA